MKRSTAFLFSLVCVGLVRGENLYVTQSGSGSQNGTSYANAWSAANFNTSGNWGGGAGKISPDDTVFLDGTFTTKLTILGSGTSGHRITLASYAPGTKAKVVGISSAGYDDIAIINLEFTQYSSANNYICIRLDSGCDRWLIEDNHFHDTYEGAIDFHTTACNDCIIRHNQFENICWIGLGASNGNTIKLNGDRNLIEYNTIGNSLDRVYLGSGNGTVIRNNSYTYSNAALFTGTSVYPFHRDDLQVGVQSSPVVTQMLWEKNYSVDNLESVGGNAHNVILQNYDALGQVTWIVLRFNAVIRTGGAFILQAIERVYGYNQTLITTELYQDGSHITNAFYYGGSVTGNLSDWRNNTWSLSPYYYQTGGGIFATTDAKFPTNFTSGYQHSWFTGTSGNLLPAAATNLGYVNPLFTDSSADNYSLQSSSPLRAAGGPITTTSGAGTNSTALTVVDAHAIFDGLVASGWAAADADWIKIGSGAYVQVASINYATNVITLTAARSWSDGDAVMVKGMEDIGALPYRAGGYTLHGTLTSVGTTYTFNVYDATNADASDIVRFVQFYVDGVPQGLIYSAPYTITSAGTVTASAYALYASPTPVISTGGGSFSGGSLVLGGNASIK